MMRFLFVFIAVLFVPFSVQAQCLPGLPCVSDEEKLDSDACDVDFMNQIYARAFLEASRETIVNQTVIKKPDSVLEYTCFDQAVQDVTEFALPIFSDSRVFAPAIVPNPGGGGGLVDGIFSGGLDPFVIITGIGDVFLEDIIDIAENLTEEELLAELEKLSEEGIEVLADSLEKAAEEAIEDFEERTRERLEEVEEQLAEVGEQFIQAGEQLQEIGEGISRIPEELSQGVEALQESLNDVAAGAEEIASSESLEELAENTEALKEDIEEALDEAEGLTPDEIERLETLLSTLERTAEELRDIESLGDALVVFEDELKDLATGTLTRAGLSVLADIIGSLSDRVGGGTPLGGSAGDIVINVYEGGNDILTPLILESLGNYLQSNFSHALLGGAATHLNYSMGEDACTYMDDVFAHAKCEDFGIDFGPRPFLTFERLKDLDPRIQPVACTTANVITQGRINRARNTDFAHVRFDRVDPKTEFFSADACQSPIKSGVQFIQKDTELDFINSGGVNVISEKPIDDVICINPGCYYNGVSSCTK